MNLWEDWLTYVKDVNYNAVLMPLKQFESSRFDRDSAWKYFDSVKGYSYGFQSLLFTWFDTPNDNLPAFVPRSFINPAMRILENTNPKIFHYLLGEALNKRLGTENLNLNQLYLKSLFHGLNLAELAAIPEEDG